MQNSRRSAVGSALRSGRKGRGFESRRLDQKYGVAAGLHRIFLFLETGKSEPRITVGSREERARDVKKYEG